MLAKNGKMIDFIKNSFWRALVSVLGYLLLYQPQFHFTFDLIQVSFLVCKTNGNAINRKAESTRLKRARAWNSIFYRNQHFPIFCSKIPFFPIIAFGCSEFPYAMSLTAVCKWRKFHQNNVGTCMIFWDSIFSI